jgi:ParB-like chromosome segregation protein Spo0J
MRDWKARLDARIDHCPGCDDWRWDAWCHRCDGERRRVHVHIAIDRIEIRERHREDLGDIAGLAESIERLGLLQPIVLTKDGVLVAGERRIAAVLSLGWQQIDAVIAEDLDDAVALLTAERDENTCRKAFTPTEEHALYEALLDLERPKAVERREQNLKRGAELPNGKVSHSGPPSDHGRAKERAAKAATGGLGRHKTLDKVGEVKKIAADDSKPTEVRSLARDALADMNASGRVDGAYQRVKDAERRAEAPKPDPRVAELVESDPGAQDARYLAEFHGAMSKAWQVVRYQPERLAGLLDEAGVEGVELYAEAIEKFRQQIRQHRSGLRVVQGGKA